MLQRLATPCCLLFMFGFVAAGCGDDDSSSATDSGADATRDAGRDDSGLKDGGMEDAGPDATTYDPITVEMFCASWRAAAERVLCMGLEDGEECAAILDSQPGAQRCAAIAESIASGRTIYDGAEGARCIAELDESDLGNGWNHGGVPACDAFSGTVREGGDCYPEASINTSECAEGWCEWDTETCPGTCKPFQAIGDVCRSGLPCAPTDLCKTECEQPCDGVCAARPKVGEACEFSCEQGSLCTDTAGGRVCVAYKKEGDACTLDTECPQGFCRSGICNPMASAKGDPCNTKAQCPGDLVCKPAARGRTCQDPTPLGDPCGDGGDECAEGGVCLTPLEGGEATCVASRGRDGDACTYLCEEDHFCSNEDETLVCRADRGMGEDCSTNMAIRGTINLPCQDGLHCMESSTQTCLPPGKLDEPCFYNRTETCEPGLWCTIIGSKCVAPVSGDDFCYSIWSDTCLPTDYCGTPDGLAGGWGTDKCYTKKDNGETCLTDNVCKSDICVYPEEGESGTCAAERPNMGRNLCVPSS